jgi:enoyl-[acyl-carrier-protein] reductase (NADH)
MINATTALRSFMQPNDIADAAELLCLDKGTAITGVTLPVDASWPIQASYASYLQGNAIRE